MSRWAGAALGLVLVASGGAVVAAAGTTASSSSSCAMVLRWEDQEYTGGFPLRQRPPLTGRLIDMVLPGCDDTGSGEAEPDEVVQVEEIEGIDPAVAVYWHEAAHLAEGAEVPPELEQYRRRRTCDPEGPTTLVTEWVGVRQRKEVRFDGDFRPPLRLDVREVETGDQLRIQDLGGADPDLGKRHARRALWSTDAYLVVDVHCEGTDFVADGYHLRTREG